MFTPPPSMFLFAKANGYAVQRRRFPMSKLPHRICLPKQKAYFCAMFNPIIISDIIIISCAPHT